MEKKLHLPETTSFTLHIIGMLTMFCDHLWATNAMHLEYLSCIGRIAYPIFAYLLAQGFLHTANVKRYLGRMALFALISEIPFNLMYYGRPIYPYHQNVYVTYCIALLGLWAVDALRKKNRWVSILGSLGVMLACFLAGYGTFADFYGIGILLVFLFYFFPGGKWYHYVAQFIGMYYVNVTVLGGYYYVWNILGHEIEVYQQSFALLALIPIWLYRGRQGHHSKPWRWFCYGFYPAHILILSILMLG